ncbi:glycosyltransferase family 2 protein [Endozoicomonas ascidiicola]|uniref:glycosyltransferase family 2 protein n=1 Tax=Endozoicomonas ascidiicola TaxID=1698521 RepID=UPI000A7CEE4A|nr:glycosyltransferase family 2 protein [Endozoicomonas ascidiicola]
MFKLSICVPTYNRKDFLVELLDSLVPQLVDSVEIVISDNASTDETEILVNEYCKTYNNISYYRNEKNIGPDLNYLKSVEHAKGDYCWLFGSDDAFKEGSIARLLCEIEKKECDVYLVDRDECDFHLNFQRKHNWLTVDTDSEYGFNNNQDWITYFNKCNSLGAVFSFLSSIVIRKQKWDLVLFDERFIESAYSHVFMILSLLKENGSLKYISDSLVLCRKGNDFFSQEGFYKRFFIDIDGYYSLSENLFENMAVRRSFRDVLVKTTPWYRLSKLYDSIGDQDINKTTKKLLDFGFNSIILTVARVCAKIGLTKLLLKVKG